MSRFLKYLVSSNKDVELAKFRAMKIKLVDEPTNLTEIIKNISEKYSCEALEILEVLNKLNSLLKKKYRGKSRFDLCIDGGKNPEDIRMDEKKSLFLKEKMLESNERLCRIQRSLEEKISKLWEKRNE
jgi:hypothetical protein